MQDAYPSDGKAMIHVRLPEPNQEVIPGVTWGFAGGLFTPAYWASNCVLFMHETRDHPKPHQLGRSLPEEMAACLLGGYGMPAELGMAAFERLRISNLLRPGVNSDVMERALSEPLYVYGRKVRYRFPKQKAGYLVRCLDELPRIASQRLGDVELRDQLMNLPGIGPKTASWIVRNWRDSDAIAILDVHVVRAMQINQVVRDVSLPKDYLAVERDFLNFAAGLNVRASVLDAVVWSHMRRWGSLANSPRAMPNNQKSPKHRRVNLELPLAISLDD